MSASKRTRSSQSQHDREVQKQANEYKRKGYQVAADLPGFSKPTTIGGYRPDVKAKKGRKEVVVEVETTDSVDSTRDVKQQGAFQRWARRNEDRQFKRKITD
jgi:hypothetical protein